DYPARARAIERVLAPGLERLRKQYPDIIADVRGAGALYGIFLDGGPRMLDLAAKLAPGGLARDPRLRTKVITCAVVNAMYQEHDVYMYYTLNGRSPLVAAPSLVAGPEEVEIFLDAFDKTLARGMNRLLAAFLKDKAVSRWAA
nr:aspartate aminotransferase family protein [Streptomyces sp. DSM 41633]